MSSTRQAAYRGFSPVTSFLSSYQDSVTHLLHHGSLLNFRMLDPVSSHFGNLMPNLNDSLSSGHVIGGGTGLSAGGAFGGSKSGAPSLPGGLGTSLGDVFGPFAISSASGKSLAHKLNTEDIPSREAALGFPTYTSPTAIAEENKAYTAYTQALHYQDLVSWDLSHYAHTKSLLQLTGIYSGIAAEFTALEQHYLASAATEQLYADNPLPQGALDWLNQNKVSDYFFNPKRRLWEASFMNHYWVYEQGQWLESGKLPRYTADGELVGREIYHSEAIGRGRGYGQYPLNYYTRSQTPKSAGAYSQDQWNEMYASGAVKPYVPETFYTPQLRTYDPTAWMDKPPSTQYTNVPDWFSELSYPVQQGLAVVGVALGDSTPRTWAAAGWEEYYNTIPDPYGGIAAYRSINFLTAIFPEARLGPSFALASMEYLYRGGFLGPEPEGYRYQYNDAMNYALQQAGAARTEPTQLKWQSRAEYYQTMQSQAPYQAAWYGIQASSYGSENLFNLRAYGWIAVGFEANLQAGEAMQPYMTQLYRDYPQYVMSLIDQPGSIQRIYGFQDVQSQVVENLGLWGMGYGFGSQLIGRPEGMSRTAQGVSGFETALLIGGAATLMSNVDAYINRYRAGIPLTYDEQARLTQSTVVGVAELSAGMALKYLAPRLFPDSFKSQFGEIPLVERSTMTRVGSDVYLGDVSPVITTKVRAGYGDAYDETTNYVMNYADMTPLWQTRPFRAAGNTLAGVGSFLLADTAYTKFAEPYVLKNSPPEWAPAIDTGARLGIDITAQYLGSKYLGPVVSKGLAEVATTLAGLLPDAFVEALAPTLGLVMEGVSTLTGPVAAGFTVAGLMVGTGNIADMMRVQDYRNKMDSLAKFEGVDIGPAAPQFRPSDYLTTLLAGTLGFQRDVIPPQTQLTSQQWMQRFQFETMMWQHPENYGLKQYYGGNAVPGVAFAPNQMTPEYRQYVNDKQNAPLVQRQLDEQAFTNSINQLYQEQYDYEVKSVSKYSAINVGKMYSASAQQAYDRYDALKNLGVTGTELKKALAEAESMSIGEHLMYGFADQITLTSDLYNKKTTPIGPRQPGVYIDATQTQESAMPLAIWTGEAILPIGTAGITAYPLTSIVNTGTPILQVSGVNPETGDPFTYTTSATLLPSGLYQPMPYMQPTMENIKKYANTIPIRGPSPFGNVLPETGDMTYSEFLLNQRYGGGKNYGISGGAESITLPDGTTISTPDVRGFQSVNLAGYGMVRGPGAVFDEYLTNPIRIKPSYAGLTAATVSGINVTLDDFYSGKMSVSEAFQNITTSLIGTGATATLESDGYTVTIHYPTALDPTSPSTLNNPSTAKTTTIYLTPTSHVGEIMDNHIITSTAMYDAQGNLGTQEGYWVDRVITRNGYPITMTGVQDFVATGPIIKPSTAVSPAQSATPDQTREANVLTQLTGGTLGGGMSVAEAKNLIGKYGAGALGPGGVLYNAFNDDGTPKNANAIVTGQGAAYGAQKGFEGSTRQPTLFVSSEFGQTEYVKITPQPQGSLSGQQLWNTLKRRINEYDDGDHSPSPTTAVTEVQNPGSTLQSEIRRGTIETIALLIRRGDIVPHPSLWDNPMANAVVNRTWPNTSAKLYDRSSV